MELENYKDKDDSQGNGTNNLVYNTSRPTQTKGKQEYREKPHSPLQLILFCIPVSKTVS